MATSRSGREAVRQRRVLDTTVVSLMLRNDLRLSRYTPHVTGCDLYISFQTIAEMRYGASAARWGPRRRAELETFLRRFELVQYSDELANAWAQTMLEARRAGRRLEAGDAWVAATARLLNAPLLTDDKDISPDACPALTIYCYAE